MSEYVYVLSNPDPYSAVLQTSRVFADIEVAKEAATEVLGDVTWEPFGVRRDGLRAGSVVIERKRVER